MDTAEIEVFLVLAEELHFGRTAERLRLPQPRVSRLVAALERRAGGALFERTSRRVRPKCSSSASTRKTSISAVSIRQDRPPRKYLTEGGPGRA